MDKDGFWHEVIDMVKHHKQITSSREPVSEEQMAQLEAKVYAHIDQVFMHSDISSETTQADVTISEKLSAKIRPSLGELLWARLVQYKSVSAVVLAMSVLISASFLTYLLSDNDQSKSLYEIPRLVANAELGNYTEAPPMGSRAFAQSLMSDRRKAFLAGVTQAGLDLVGDIEKANVKNAVFHYYRVTTKTTADDLASAFENLKTDVAQFSSSEQYRLWLLQGYAVEIVYLAAKRTMVDLNTDVLNSALQFFVSNSLSLQMEKPAIDNHDLDSSVTDVPKQYIRNHEVLLSSSPMQLPTPASVQEIVDIARNMKILIQ